VRRHRRKRILVHALMIPATLFLALPVVWLLLLSFRPDAVVLRGVDSLTSPEFVLSNYQTLFARFNVPRYLLNSLIASVVPAAVSVIVAAAAGYALVRFNFRGRGLFYSLPLIAQVVPLIQLIVPLYIFMLALNLLDTYAAVILGHLTLVLPLGVWMMAAYLRAVPADLEEAAMIDGCSRLGALYRVVLPVAIPGIIAVGVVAFLETWGEFLMGYILTSTQDMRLMAIAVYTFVPGGQTPTTWGLLFAAAAVFMVPSLLLFVVLQRSMRQGVAMGAVAGR
jgi:ABC-type glycerol-3-phosphate transport system permease component